MDLTKQIKELEKKANEADRYKTLYEEQGKAIEEAIKKLSGLIGIPLVKGGKKITKTEKIKQIAKIIFDILENDDSIQYNGNDLDRFLIDHNITPEINARNILRNELRKLNGISERKDGAQICLYYNKPKETNKLDLPNQKIVIRT